MKVKFWGVRGSIPCPGPATQKYGGNTSCLQILGGSEIVIVDAGTGIRELGLELMKKPPSKVHLLLTHTHWDHIQGFPFFPPIYRAGNEIHIYGPGTHEKTLEEALLFQMQHTYFPVSGVELAAKIRFTQIEEISFQIGTICVSTKFMNHPIRVLAYKFQRGNRTLVYTGDNEPYENGRPDHEANQEVQTFVAGADLLIADTQYTDEEYATKHGWGHSSLSHVLDLALGANVKRLALFHHEPTHTDRHLDGMERLARKLAAKRTHRLRPFMAREGMQVAV